MWKLAATWSIKSGMSIPVSIHSRPWCVHDSIYWALVPGIAKGFRRLWPLALLPPAARVAGVQRPSGPPGGQGGPLTLV